MAKKKRFKARVTVYPRPEILDPRGKAIGDALRRLGFGRVLEVRAGKSFDIVLEGASRQQAQEVLEQMCSRLLANPVIEDYSFELSEEAS